MNTKDTTEQKKCIVLGTPLILKPYTNNLDSRMDYVPVCWKISDENRAYKVYNLQAGGKYISKNLLYCNGELALDSNHKLTDKEKIRLSGWIAKENLRDNTPPVLESVIKDKNSLEMLPPIPNPSERAYLLLEGLVRETDVIGKTFSFNNLLKYPFEDLSESFYYSFFYALSYCSDKEEMKYLFNYLQELKFITFNGHTFYVTVKGFEKNASNIKSKTAFIAMWFDEHVNNVKESIKVAVRNAGYELPQRMDEKEHINKIDDEILVNINKARFVVCDLTSKRGDRGSVYFEAGYAMGKNIHVIWTCNKNRKKKMAFDIRQYNCLFWEKDNMDEFTYKLQKRIESVIGIGPLKENSKK